MLTEDKTLYIIVYMMKTNPTTVHGLIPFWYDFYLPMNCSRPSESATNANYFSPTMSNSTSMSGFNVNNDLPVTFMVSEDLGTTTQLTKYRGIESAIYATRCLAK